jgi:hypothetical protein
MFALGRVYPQHLTLKRTAARGCSVPIADIWRTSPNHRGRTPAIIEPG